MGCCWPTPTESYQPEQEGTMPAPVTRAPSEISLGDIFDRYKTAHPERFRTFDDPVPPPKHADPPSPPIIPLQRKNHITHITA